MENLLIRGGRVIDPANGIDAVIAQIYKYAKK